MRVSDFDKNKLFDVIDDMAIYMRNDPMVYRKSLFPAIINMQNQYNKGKLPNAEKCLGEIVDNAMISYCNKFKLGSPKNVFKKTDRQEIIKKLYSEEMTQIKNGSYK